MNFFPHHISTPSKPPNNDFPKIVDFTNKEISWKWCSNSEKIEKTWLLQESITNPTTSFEVFVNKKLTFKLLHYWCRHHNFLEMLSSEKKTANIVPTVFEQKFVFETFRLHFSENNWLMSNNSDQIGRPKIARANARACSARARACAALAAPKARTRENGKDFVHE